MKRIFSFIALIALTACLFAGCSSEKKLVILDDKLSAEEYGIGFRKDDTQLHNAIMSTYNSLKDDGTIAKISTEWFGKDISLEKVDVPADSVPEGKTTFILGLDASFPPMGFTDESGNIVGYDIDIAKAVCEKLGLELKLQPIDWSAKELELNTGNIDCIWNGMTITDERKESMLMSAPYLANNQVIVVAEGSTIKSRADLAGKSVAVQTESSGEEALKADPISSECKEIVQFADYVSAFQDLKVGRIDAVVVDEIVARYYVSK